MYTNVEEFMPREVFNKQSDHIKYAIKVSGNKILVGAFKEH